jgi:Uma2 family endonuclease
MAETLTILKVGPENHGQRMTLDDFARAEGRPGYIYELEEGTIVVDVPKMPHNYIQEFIRDELAVYRRSKPQVIRYIAEPSTAALRMPEMQSERHPDLSIYLTPAPIPDAQPWDCWIPEIAIEIVSASSAHRDYHTKRNEYLKAGVKLYWIIDPRDRTATVLTRQADRWQEQKLDAAGVLTTNLLPGLELKLADVFAAAG